MSALLAPPSLPTTVTTSHLSEAYAVYSWLTSGSPLKRRPGHAWTVGGQTVPNEVVRDLYARGFIVPAPGESWDHPSAFHLSAVGWRMMGRKFADKTAEIEAGLYEVAGTAKDNDTARKYRSITAEWRARQARKEIAPTWEKWCEFSLNVPDTVNGGSTTVTVVFEPGRPSAPDFFEFHGNINDKGFYRHVQGQGATLRGTVSQRAYEVVAPLCAIMAEDKRLAHERLPKPKPVLRVLEAGEDAEALARDLGLL